MRRLKLNHVDKRGPRKQLTVSNQDSFFSVDDYLCLSYNYRTIWSVAEVQVFGIWKIIPFSLGRISRNTVIKYGPSYLDDIPLPIQHLFLCLI